MNVSRPALSLKQAYERVKSALNGLINDVDKLDPIAKNSAGNGIYNGKMTISQRGDYTSATGATNGVYYLDRWIASFFGVTATIQDTGGAMKVAATSASIGVMGGFQKVENFAKYKNTTVTISAKVISNHADARFRVYDGANNFYSSSHTGGGGEEDLSITLSLGNITALFVYCRIQTSASDPSITSGDYIEFTDVRLDLGEHRLSGDREYAEELALCQRYYWKSESGQNHYAHAGHALATQRGTVQFPEKMRASPTVTYTAVGTVDAHSTTEEGITFNASSTVQLNYINTITASAEL